MREMTDVAREPGSAPGWDAHVHVFDADAPVLAGHYRPAHQPLQRVEAEAVRLGVNHLVLVQPSVYGTDNQCLLAALARDPGRHRGVVVVDAGVTDDALQEMHALGVRGVRFNLVSPVGNGAADLEALAPRLKALGWHVQWYAAASQLPEIVRWHTRTGLPCVLDHMAGLHAELAPDDAAWQSLAQLADLGAWVKLSGWYRLRAHAPYEALLGTIERVAQQMPGRMVWGSDWPHTAFAPDALPPYVSVWEPVVAALGLPRALLVRAAAAQLYR